MEYEDKTDPRYVERFNFGYALAKHIPELSDQLFKSKSQAASFLAMRDGRNQYLSEQAREKLPSWLAKDPSKIISRLLSRDKGKSNEPDR